MPKMIAVIVLLLPFAACHGAKETTGIQVASRDQCMFSGVLQKLMFHALIPIHYTKGTDEPYSRQLYQLECRLEDDQCEGVQLHVDAIDRGRPLGIFDLGLVGGAKLFSVSDKTVTILWGAFRKFTIDFKHNLITYAESGEGVNGPIEGRGEVKCEATWIPLVVRPRQGPDLDPSP